MAARGGPSPGPAPQVAAVGQQDAPRPPPAPRRRRPPRAPPDFVTQRPPDDDGVLLVLPGVPAPRRPTAAPRRKRRRREEEEEAAEAEGVGQEQSPWGARLPPELLARIFWAVVEDEGAVPFLCRAARVCRLWREAAAAPPLWRRVSLGGGRDPRTPPRAPARLLRALRALPPHRLSQLRELSLSGWRSHVGDVLRALWGRCPRLESLSLSRCGGVPALPPPPEGPPLSRLRLRLCRLEGGALGGFLAGGGGLLLELRLSCAPRPAGGVLAALAAGQCPRLQLLELDTALGGGGPPLPLPPERLQAALPHLQVLRVLNAEVSVGRGRGALPPPGFPALLELSLAGPGGGVTGGLLPRLLGGSPCLRLLDLRGAARVAPTDLLGLPCTDLEQLYLGLPCGAEPCRRMAEGSAALVAKWRRSLRELDLAGRPFEPHDLAGAVAALGPRSPLRSLNLAGTKVTAEALRGLLEACPELEVLNLSACRRLPRGTKRAHRGRQEVRSCLRRLVPRGREALGEEALSEEALNEEALNEETLNEEKFNETVNEMVNEKMVNEEKLNEEKLGEEMLNEKNLNELKLNKETLNEEKLNKEKLSEEVLIEKLNEENLNEEMLDEEMLDEEKLSETLNEETLNKEMLNEEKLNKEKLSEEMLNEENLNELKLNKEPLNEEKLNKEKLNEEMLDEKMLDEEKLNEEPLSEEPLNEEMLNKETLNEEKLSEEPLNKNVLNKEMLNEETRNEEMLIEEPLSGDTPGEETLNEEKLNEEMLIEETSNEALNEELLGEPPL